MKILQSLAASSVNAIGRVSSGTRVQKVKKIKINFYAVSFATGTMTSTQTRSRTQCHSISARHSMCVSRADRCHTALMQTGIRRASDLLPRPRRSPLISSHRIHANLPNEREDMHTRP